MIEFRHVSKTYGQQKAVDDLNLRLGEGSFSVLIGTSGSGKSTTLKMINRLVEHDSGQIRFAGEEIRSLPVLELRRRMGYAIQSIGLFPHWTVAQNIATVLQLEKWSRTKIAERVDELMSLLGLEPALRDRYPHQLSGGQQQRVGVARALAANPQVLLMDEPFGALDAHTRILLQRELLRIWQHHKTTILFVTHGVDEAVYLADRVVVMSARPGTVRAVVPVDIPRPRHRGDPEYARLTASILEMLDSSAGAGRRDEQKSDAGGCPCR